MPKCRDCLHWEACREYVTRSAAARGVDLDTTELEQIFDSDGCDHFHDSSRFVELPCKVGDRLYVPIPKSKYIVEYVVIALWIEESGTIIRVVDTRFFTVNILFTQDIGTKAFLTKEEAEQALNLKERESND